MQKLKICLRSKGVDLTKLIGCAIDGAYDWLAGVIAKFKNDFPYLVAIHGLSHQLHLAANWAVKSNHLEKLFKEIDNTLKKFAKLFIYSPNELKCKKYKKELTNKPLQNSLQ